MNLFAFFDKGIAASGIEARKTAVLSREMEAARTKWLDALMADETRAWMSLGEESRDTLNGLAALLTLAGLCHGYDHKTVDAVEIRVIRGAISAAQQCARGGYEITVSHAQAFSGAAAMARTIFSTCTHGAMAYAAEYLDASTRGMPSV